MDKKVRGFLLFEASMAFLIACLAINLLVITVGQSRKIEKGVAQKVDSHLAHYIMKSTSKNHVVIHDRTY